MENTENTFITLGNLRRFLENLNVDMDKQTSYINQQDVITDADIAQLITDVFGV